MLGNQELYEFPMQHLPLSFLCNGCGATFESRNNLFRHLKNTDKTHGLVEDSPAVTQPNKKQCIEDQRATDDGILVVCEDEWYRVVSKPQGLATMGPKGVTLLKSDRMLLPDAIKLNLPYKKAVPCHRLDKETGGVMLCSKSKLAERTIMVSFRYKLVRKKYLALVIGKLEPPQGVISLPISGKPASTKFAVTSYTRSAQYEWLTTVQLWPITGKRHQLRRHMQAVGHSIVGDKRYSMAELWDTVVRTDIPHMFLWAVEIDFPHPQHCTGLVDGTTEDLRMGALNDSGSDEEDAYGAEDDIDDTAQPAAAERGGVNIIDGSRARQQGMAQIIERVRTLPAACRVVASIDEPSYYGVFREIHQRSWDENQTEDAVQS